MFMTPPKKSDDAKTLTREVQELRAVIDTAHKSFRTVHQVRRTLAISFLQGAASALGALALLVVITPLVIWALQSVAWPPLIADFIARVILQYEQVNRQSPRGVDGQ